MSDVARVRPLNRVLAKFVDLFIVMAVAAAILYPIGPFLGFVYSLVADGLPFGKMPGQSLGKKLFKLRVVSIKHGRPCGWKESIQRNTPVGVATFFALIPVWGWVILAIIGFPLMIIEIYLLVKAPRGQRLGDVMADTEVVPASPAGAA